MESAQYTGGSSPSTNNNTHTTRNSSTQPRQQRGSSQPPRRTRPSARPPPSDSGDATSTTGGSERERGSDVEELGRFPPTPSNHSRSPQSRSGSARRPPSSNPRTAPTFSVPTEDAQLVDPIPRRPAVPSRRSVPRRIPRLGGENGTSSAASDTDTTSSSSSSGPAPIRRRPLRTRTEGRLSLRGPILEQSREGNIVPPGVEYGPDYDGTRPLPPRTRNPRAILNDGERGFIVDLKMNLEIEIELKAAIMGDLTLSVL
ncbi:hypothetical protein CPLU01_00752 [Colletotrichum plurivorum]|uniref:Uncharacterized protein n=1 Tax=Colletotrichum plurivorum TaxID=2175906 RepID=A0A8H6U5S0_9PEZI|nr:hypothetical protein CPLU01_00752 [Colletotrichum plurivorum]